MASTMFQSHMLILCAALTTPQFCLQIVYDSIILLYWYESKKQLARPVQICFRRACV